MSNVTSLPTPENVVETPQAHRAARLYRIVARRTVRAWRIIRGLVEVVGWAVVLSAALSAYMQMP